MEQYIINIAFAIVIIVLMFVVVNLNNKLKKIEKIKTNIQPAKVKREKTTGNDAIKSMETDIDILIEQGYKQGKVLDSAFSKIGIENFDAFGNVGGNLSFSIALLNNDDTGIILTSIHQEEGSHLYLKEVISGKPYKELSEEEYKALNKALQVIVINDLRIK